jgi:Predicted transcriptional regulator
MIEYKIAEVLEKRGISARQLAAGCGIGHNTAALLAKAKSNYDYNVCADVLDRVCGYLGLGLGSLLRYRKKPLKKAKE